MDICRKFETASNNPLKTKSSLQKQKQDFRRNGYYSDVRLF